LGRDGSYPVETVVIDKKPNTVPAGDILEIDQYFNSTNTSLNNIGQYRVYAEVVDANNVPIHVVNGEALSDYWDFIVE